MGSHPRSVDEIIQVFDKYLITTSLPMPDIHKVSLLPSKEVRTQNTEEQLVLYNRKLSKTEVSVLKDYILRSHPFLTKLHLNNNRVGPEGAQTLATLLENNRTGIQELFLNRNFLYNEGVIAIATSMKSNTNIKQLKIAMNGAEDEGAKAVAEMIRSNASLKGLEFDQNKYTSAGLAALADALNKNKSIKVIQVGEANKIKSRLQFVRMMIQTEDPNHSRTGAVLCFSKDKNNDIIDLLLEEWRLCKAEGKELIQLPGEYIERFSRFNKLNENEMEEMYSDIKALLREARERGVKDLKQAKILLMGRAEAGKTSLMQSLIAGRSLLTGDGEDRATVSVDTRKWTIENAKCTFWDFGGQEEYYMTHSFFVTPRCIVIICVNLFKYTDCDECYQHNIQYFIDAIQSHAPGAKFVIVGTHGDKLAPGDGRKIRRSIQERFQSCEKERMQKLEKAIRKLDPKEARKDQSKLSESDAPELHSSRRKTGKSQTGTLRSTALESEDASLAMQAKLTARGKNSHIYKAVSMNSSIGLIGKAKGNLVTLNDDDIDVIVDPAEEVALSKGFGNGSRLGRLNNVNEVFEQKNITAKQKLKEDKLIKLLNRRDKRPTLLGVRVISSGEDITGMEEFKKTLKSWLVDKSEELEISAQLPAPYATLYESLTGEQLLLKNSHITYDKSMGIGRPMSFVHESVNRFKRVVRASAVNRKSMPAKADESIMGMSKKKGKKKSVYGSIGGVPSAVETFDQRPIVQVTDLYKEFVTSPQTVSSAATRNARMTFRRNKNQTRIKLFDKPEKLHSALRALHEIGYLLWYENDESLRHIVFVDPQWVVQMIKTVIRHNMFGDGAGALKTLGKPDGMTLEEFSAAKDLFREQATLDSRLLFSFEMWRDSDERDKFHMINLMRNFDLLCEQPRLADKELIPKYFIPVYLKTAFLERATPGNRDRMEKLEEDFIENSPAIPKFTQSLFTGVEPPPSALTRLNPRATNVSVNNNSSFFQGDPLRPKNIQWRYEFKDYFPEALFLRLLIRCHPYVQFDEKYKPTERFAVGRAALGVTIFIQAEREKYGLAGALVLTAIQEMPVESASFRYNMRDIWQVFSLFAFELEDLLSMFPGLDTSVYVCHVTDTVGKVIIPRESLEVHDLEHNDNPKKQYRRIKVKLGAVTVPMHFLIPPLYVLPYEYPPNVPRRAIQFTQPELVRLSKIAKIEYGLMMIEAQAAEEVTGQRTRVQIMHRQLLGFVGRLLRLLCVAVNPKEHTFVRGFDSSLQVLKQKHVEEVIALEEDILKMRRFEESAFQFENNFITKMQLDKAVQTCRDLFKVLEKKLIIKENEPLTRRKKNMLM